MLNAGRLAVVLLSDTVITILLQVPTLLAVGVPLSFPVILLKLAQAGLLLMLNLNLSPSASVALGWKE
jgi:hypothetical protein